MRDCRTAIAGLADLAARQPFFIVDRWKVKVESRLTSRGLISKNGGWVYVRVKTLSSFRQKIVSGSWKVIIILTR